LAAFYEPGAGEVFDPVDLTRRCVESGARSLLLDEHSLPGEFFRLSTGTAGELLHHLGKYRLRLAAVVADPTAHSVRFQEFVREANRGGVFRFFSSRVAALDWLEHVSS